ncbi:T9SS type A sorting domain-containing protein [Flavobacterium sp. '19STA2R22 D10 B1']|uniref:T9SS type A sorting domain-containing protein n=1 Tax=Flavobacterium aerium TaxID=3037261 RepID=UPI00278C0D4E|nr:T9SS type A sorting domain-containing protein [Flavobacterium sp. '19STA2R22 D10 B1']
MKKLYVLTLLLLTGHISYSQSFEEVTTAFATFYFASSDISDYDNDGDLDVIICGGIDTSNAGGPTGTGCVLYSNDNGVFTAVEDLGINPLHLGDIKFIDINNDGLQDVVISGQNYDDITQHILYIYKNTGTGFQLLQQADGMIYCNIEVMDINHDGKLDFILTGVGGNTGRTTKLFTNNGTNFDISTIAIPESQNALGVQNGNLKVVDINNDGNLDFITMGIDYGENYILKVYSNTNGTFTLKQQFPGYYNGSISVADFNADGFMDFVVSGTDINEENKIKVFYNDGQGNFTEHYSDTDGLAISSGSKNIIVGDINNDGYYDFIVAGSDNDNNDIVKTYIYSYESSTFNLATDPTGIAMLGGTSNIQFFDYNGDHNSDVLLSGFNYDPQGEYVSMTKLFKNTSTIANEKPIPPTTLSSELLENNTVKFTWSGASDDKTQVNALTYYLRVGTTAGARDVAYYPITTSQWELKFSSVPQNLFWAVESVDASLIKSLESEEQTFSTLSTPENQNSFFTVYPNPTRGTININYSNGLPIESIELFNMAGQMVKSQANSTQLDVSGLSNGIYILKLNNNNTLYTQKIIKQ